MDLVYTVIETLLLVIGGAAVIVSGLEKIAEVTPTTKDDKYVGKIKHYLGVISYWLDRLSLGLPQHKARKE